MILEVAVLDIIPGQEGEFRLSFAKAQRLVASMKGYLGHELNKCIEKRSRYLLLVRWEELSDHALGFRGSPEYQEWKQLLHHYYDPFPEVEHYVSVLP